MISTDGLMDKPYLYGPRVSQKLASTKDPNKSAPE